MSKKTGIVILVIALIFAGGGFLLWQNSQAAVKDLNSSLPEGVRVVKSLFGNEYKVVNKIDGYEFKIPDEWRKLRYVEYRDVIGNTESSYRLAMSTELQSIISSESTISIGGGNLDGIDMRTFSLNKPLQLENFVEQLKPIIAQEGSFGGSEISFRLDNFASPNINGLKLTSILKTRHGSVMDPHDVFYIFMEDKIIYVLMHYDDDLVKNIIANGRW